VKKFTWIILVLLAAAGGGCSSSDDDDSNGDGSGDGEAGSGGSGEADAGEAGSGGSDGAGDEMFFDCDPEENKLGLYGMNCPVMDPEECDTSRRPIVIVHGGWGTADQFEELALRFASNGYCTHYMVPYDYVTMDNMAGVVDQTMADLESVIDDILQATGDDQVDLIGHSLGTRVSSTYLSNSEARAAKVAHYAQVEGGSVTGNSPGGVPTITFIAADAPTMGGIGGGGELPDATNIFLTGGVDHVGAATHIKTFEEMFKFFNDGEEPATLEILPGSQIRISGKLVEFHTSQAVARQPGEEGYVDIFEVDKDTGERLNEEPNGHFVVRQDGTWGPFEAKPDTYYELVMSSEMREETGHYFREPFIRSDAFVYLKHASMFLDTILYTDDHTFIITVRNKAMWRGEDVLTVEGTEVSDSLACEPSDDTIALFLYDDLQDGQSELEQSIAMYDALPFINGLDYFIPSTPRRTIEVKVVDRDSGAEHVLNVPSLKSRSEGIIAVQFNDFD
jgi:pimeloyl-ACP methyl ester carboxylesterase